MEMTFFIFWYPTHKNRKEKENISTIYVKYSRLINKTSIQEF